MTRVVMEIWEDTLRRTDFRAEDDFFELGGDSMDAARTLAALRKRTGALISLSEMFQQPTCEGIGKLISGRVNGHS
ncbi:phosphopantetheine-binding protein [Actinomadura sp. ATCC 39365]